MNPLNHRIRNLNIEWFDDYDKQEDDFQVDEYDITATPNDFNVITIYNFIESGAVVIPGFQRNYVWDIKRASKLVESLVLGLPVPQIFLYEETRNRFLVIDGQQRLMSIYYFIKQRFPRNEKRPELRTIFQRSGRIPDEILHNDLYFSNFNLDLPEQLPKRPNKFKGLNYATLGDYRMQLDLRPVRNVIVKQNTPEDDSSIYEIFNRLNTGGVNLRPQEIRMSLYHSKFYDMLYRVNLHPQWRRLLQVQEPDLHGKDVEILMRSLAILMEGKNYGAPLARFLNLFSKRCKLLPDEKIFYLEQLCTSFFQACTSLPDDAFYNKKNRRFNIALFEAVFALTCVNRIEKTELLEGEVKEEEIRALEADNQYNTAALEGTSSRYNLMQRLERAQAIITPL